LALANDIRRPSFKIFLTNALRRKPE